jgi:RES domain-containing protein
MDLWRISNHLTLNGEGGRRAPARWHSGGEPIVYLASATGTALVEVLVHLEAIDNQTPRHYTLLHITAPDDLDVPLLLMPENENWISDLALTRRLGDEWLASRSSVLARVPSAILPFTFNYLLNPLHSDATRIQIVSSQQASFDPRLLR